IDFYADWCAPCKIMDPVIEEIEKELGGKLEVQKIDVDKNSDLQAKYNVFSIPTYVIEKDNREVERLVGARPKQQLVDILNRHLG
ncbi:MAG TPA: thioredoxin, partial [Patescibacteria group bacterium]